MRRALAVLVMFVLTSSGFGQGTILFNNRTPTGDARVTLCDGTGPGPEAKAQLMLVGQNGSLTPLLPVTTFRDSPQAARYFVNPVTVIVPGVPTGSPATVRMRAWIGDRYETAVSRGESNDVFLPYLGGGPAHVPQPLPDPPLSGLQSFYLCIPEPSTITILVLGAAALLTGRRKR